MVLLFCLCPNHLIDWPFSRPAGWLFEMRTMYDMVVYFDFCCITYVFFWVCWPITVAISWMFVFFRLYFHPPIHHKFWFCFVSFFFSGCEYSQSIHQNLSNQMLMFAFSTLNCAHQIPCMPTTRNFWMLRVFMLLVVFVFVVVATGMLHIYNTSVYSQNTERTNIYTRMRSSAIDMWNTIKFKTI